VIDNLKGADHIVMVTCAFKESKERESLEWIRRLKRYGAHLIVAGCLPSISPKRLEKEFNGDLILTKALWKIDDLFMGFKYKFNDIPDSNYVHAKISGLDFPNAASCVRYLKSWTMRLLAIFSMSRHFYQGCLWQLKMSHSRTGRAAIAREEGGRLFNNLLRVSYGCLGHCAYCGIRHAVGRLISKSPEMILAEYKKMLHHHKRHFVFVGDDVGAYGLDRGSSFPELCAMLSVVDEGLDARWHIEHLHPVWVIKYRSELTQMIRGGRIASILCPIQSGSRRILKMMNRYGDVDNLVDILLDFKKHNSQFVISTHIIVGFPSETDDDFMATLSVLRKIRFYLTRIHVYTDREGTDAFYLADKIRDDVIRKRVYRAKRLLLQEGLPYVSEDK
jgi:tRNA A37 methylthiotransferase MiaB